MKKTISIILSLCILCSLYIAPPVSAAVTIPEDFDVFYYNDFGSDVTYSYNGKMSKYTNGGTSTVSNGVLKCVVGSGVKSNSYIDFSNGLMSAADYVVVDVVVTPIKVSTDTNISIFDGRSSTWRSGLDLNSSKQITMASDSGKVQLGTWKANTPVRISVIYDQANAKADVYIDGKKVKSKVAVEAKRPTLYRVDLTSQETGRGLEFNIDNVMLYSGNKIRSAEEIKSYTHNSVMDSEISARKSLGTASAYTVESSYYYTNGEKKTYASESQQPIFYGDGAYVSDEFLSGVLGLNIHTSASSNAVTVNGKSYMPAEDAAKALGKKYHYDNRGYFIFSDKEFPYVTTEHFKNIYDKDDVIYRYLYFANPTGAQMIADYNNSSTKGQYPRFLFTDSDVTYMKAQVKAKSADWVKAYNAKADGGYSGSVLTLANTYCSTAFNNKSAYFSFIDEAHSPSDSKKHSNTTILKSAMETLAFAYHISGDSKYAKRAVEIMDLVTGWSSIEGSGELTRGQWAMGLAMGYDAFYDYLMSTSGGAEKLASYRQIAIDKLLTVAAQGYRDKVSTKWILVGDNFNGVVSSGVMGILIAMGEDLQKEYADYGYLLENVVKTMEIAASLYSPDGGYYEGLGYGDYNMDYFTRTLNAMYNCFGTDYGISNARGLDESARPYIYLQTKSKAFNFHDSSADTGTMDMPLAFTYRHGKLEHSAVLKQEAELRGDYICAFPLLQYEKALNIHGTPDITDYPLDAYFETIGTGTFRNTFNSKKPIFAGFHGGWTTVAHGMLDVGSFVFEESGVMWAHDIGGEGSYPSGYFTNNGYKYYRKRPEGENCVVINPKVDSATYHGQAFDTTSKLIRYETGARGALSAFDLTDVYARDVSKYHRGYYFGDDRRTYTVQDEITLKDTSELYWFMHTPADIKINSPTSATLTYDTRQLNVEVYCSEEGYSLLDMDPAPLPSTPAPPAANSANTGRKLAIHCPKAKGDVTIIVKLIPVNNNYSASAIENIAISQWSIPTGEIDTPVIFSVPDECNYKNAIATVQLPESTASAEFYVDGVEVDGFSIAPGSKDTVSIPIANMAKGSHFAELKIAYSDGRRETYSKRFDFVPLKNIVSLEHPLTSLAQPEKSIWTMSSSQGMGTATGCITEKISGEGTESFIQILSDAPITGKITVECEVKSSSNAGQFIIMGYNGDGEEFGQTKYPLDSGKYNANQWYKLSMEIETLERYGFYRILVDGVESTVKMMNTLVKHYGGAKILYSSLDSAEKTVSFRNLKVTFEDVFSEGVSLDSGAVHNTVTIKATANANNMFPTGKATLVIASYDDKRLLDVVQHKDIALTVGTPVEKTLKFSDGAKYVKAMIYDSSDIHTPICTSEYYFIK